jgi:carbamoyltransferase
MELLGALGLAKVMYSSSVGLVPLATPLTLDSCELYLTERLTRKKASGLWPSLALKKLLNDHGLTASQLIACDNRDVLHPDVYEDILDTQFPFYENLKREKIECFSRKFNQGLEFVPHHEAHAYVAELVSPFEKALVVVFDGAGSAQVHVQPNGSPALLEEWTVFTLDKNRATPLMCESRQWQEFMPGVHNPTLKWSQGIGMFYETVASYIFGSNQAAGKVMGLASFGRHHEVSDRRAYLDGLDWSKKFLGSTKLDWENAGGVLRFAALAATAQAEFEQSVLTRLEATRCSFPAYDKLILVGGCALNCTTNMKIIKSGLYSELYVPQFPGDGGLGLGLAYKAYVNQGGSRKFLIDHDQQLTALGPRHSVPGETEIVKKLGKYKIVKLDNLVPVAKLLNEGQIIAWFNGRSESGPRALGNRSILAKVDIPNLKNYLNEHVKFRESFRPYGCSCLWEDGAEYFDVPKGFNNPFMSFAVAVREEYKELLKEVTHVDGTSRMQTVRKGANPRYYELLGECKRLWGNGLLLNTSLNVMGEPIVETIDDLVRFFDQSVVGHLVVEGFLVSKNE